MRIFHPERFGKTTIFLCCNAAMTKGQAGAVARTERLHQEAQSIQDLVC